jgi:hypothetical protein
VQFSDYPIMKIHLNNTGEFISQAFDNFCTFIGIDIEHHVAHIHIQNGLAKSFTKRL